MIVLHAVQPRPVDRADTRGLREHVAGEVSVLYTQADHEPAASRMAVLEHGTRIVRNLLDRWARDVRALPDGRRIAVLVRCEDAPAVRDAVVESAVHHDDVEVIVTGPWPPFSFCEETQPS